MSESLAWLADELRDGASQGLLRRRRTVRLLADGWYEVDGRRVLNFASNDYLNLAGDPRVIAAATEALYIGSRFASECSRLRSDCVACTIGTETRRV